ncbi:MAG: glycoside hydrolase family 3 N-terminal domain-containing protein [Chloroflexota bacterium]
MRRITRRGFLAAGAGAVLTLGGRTRSAGAALGTSVEPRVSHLVSGVSPLPLEEKIGQMLLVGFRGNYLDNANPIVDAISNLHIGGVILFDGPDPTIGNIGSPEQLHSLTASLQALAPTRLFIAVDEEGGNVARLNERNGFPFLPSQQYLGNLNDTSTTRYYADTTASVLVENGINLNLAPVVDLDINPSNPIIGALGRSFSSDPDVVVNHSFEVIAAHLQRRVFCALKHFPGHGSSAGDSHLGFVDVTNTWSPIELEPFRRIIDWKMRMAIMTAHIFNANLDPDLPATLSHKTVTGLLREKLRFDGVVISDDMQMHSITDYYSFETAIELAVKAGVDIINIGTNMLYGPDTVSRAIGAIRGLVDRGEIPIERIDQSHSRIMRLKALF